MTACSIFFSSGQKLNASTVSVALLLPLEISENHLKQPEASRADMIDDQSGLGSLTAFDICKTQTLKGFFHCANIAAIE
jgi:hypothetical protein